MKIRITEIQITQIKVAKFDINSVVILTNFWLIFAFSTPSKY